MSMICLIMPVSTGLDAGVHESIDLVIAPYVRSLLKFLLILLVRKLRQPQS